MKRKELKDLTDELKGVFVKYGIEMIPESVKIEKTYKKCFDALGFPLGIQEVYSFNFVDGVVRDIENHKPISCEL